MIITVDSKAGSRTSDDDSSDVVDLSKVNRPPGAHLIVVVASCCIQVIVDCRASQRYVRTSLPSSFAIRHIAYYTCSYNQLNLVKDHLSCLLLKLINV